MSALARSVRAVFAAAIIPLASVSQLAVAQDARLVGRLAPPTLAAITGILDSARVAGVPTEPLVQRALEGASRNVPPERIVATVRAWSSRLKTARTALGPSSDAELVAGASALYLGLAPARLERLRRTFQTVHGSRDLVLPLIVLADMIERGVPRDTAISVIETLGAARVSDESFQILRQSVVQDIQAGAAPGAAASTRARLYAKPGAVPPIRQPPPESSGV